MNYISPAPSRKPKHRYLYHPAKQIRPGLSYEDAQAANTYYHFKACLRIWRVKRSLEAARIRPSQRMVARIAKACTKTVRKALCYSFKQVIFGVREALDVLSSKCSRSLKRLTTFFSNSLFRTKNRKEEKLSRDPELAAIQLRCFARARENIPPPPVVKQKLEPRVSPNDLSVILKPNEKKLWFSDRKGLIKNFLDRKFEYWRRKSGRAPEFIRPKHGPFAIWRLQSH